MEYQRLVYDIRFVLSRAENIDGSRLLFVSIVNTKFEDFMKNKARFAL